jgi:RimJ/RimL family protein N-acetyltransferase
MARRLAAPDFSLPVMTTQGLREVHVGPEWPGDPLPAFPAWIAALDGDDDPLPDTYVVVTRGDGEAVGMAGAKGGPDENGVQEIGYGMNPSARGRGYATEAVGALVAELLSHHGVRALTAFTAVHNQASQRVLAKLGFTPNGTAWDSDDGDLISWSLRNGS